MYGVSCRLQNTRKIRDVVQETKTNAVWAKPSQKRITGMTAMPSLHQNQEQQKQRDHKKNGSFTTIPFLTSSQEKRTKMRPTFQGPTQLGQSPRKRREVCTVEFCRVPQAIALP